MEHVLVGTSFSELGRSARIVWSKSPKPFLRSHQCSPGRSGLKPKVVVLAAVICLLAIAAAKTVGASVAGRR